MHASPRAEWPSVHAWRRNESEKKRASNAGKRGRWLRARLEYPRFGEKGNERRDIRAASPTTNARNGLSYSRARFLRFSASRIPNWPSRRERGRASRCIARHRVYTIPTFPRAERVSKLSSQRPEIASRRADESAYRCVATHSVSRFSASVDNPSTEGKFERNDRCSLSLSLFLSGMPAIYLRAFSSIGAAELRSGSAAINHRSSPLRQARLKAQLSPVFASLIVPRSVSRARSRLAGRRDVRELKRALWPVSDDNNRPRGREDSPSSYREYVPRDRHVNGDLKELLARQCAQRNHRVICWRRDRCSLSGSIVAYIACRNASAN